MRCVIVSDFGAVNGGAAKVAIESARGLAEAGVDVVFACAIGPVSPRLDHPRIDVQRFEGEEVWKVGGRIAAARQGIWNAAAHAFLTALLKRQPPGTIVHLHQWTKAFSPAAIAAAAESRLPVAITLHDYFSFCPTGGYFDFKAGRPCARRPMSGACLAANCDRESYGHKLVRVARQWRSDTALRALRSPLFIHVSALAARVAEPFLPTPSRHLVLANMIETTRLSPADVAANRPALFLGRFTQEKGVLVAAAAARAADIPLRLVGDGEAAIRAEIARLCPAAQFTGWVDAAAVVEAVRAARCVVAPSLWYETGPMTVAETMAQGVPTIVSRTIGAAEAVAHGRNGFVVTAGDTADLTESLKQIRRDDVVGPMGRAAYDDYWAKPQSVDRHVAGLQEAYGRLLAGA
ncbi:glycosyltransferase family 4 protein [Bosea sp. RAC05]|uniref:glycosyltransferase family 4 protein n=1 Tax=Bosea sp. RAC05 TaxID=1842539 RepID=UPI00083CB0E4|nr:glycosyltransferase family 4 protein [Bosea sp. RAC05]AOG07068.1 glycosyl transferases group 1 family protein [Bosea sp. RAC05]